MQDHVCERLKLGVMCGDSQHSASGVEDRQELRGRHKDDLRGEDAEVRDGLHVEDHAQLELCVDGDVALFLAHLAESGDLR